MTLAQIRAIALSDFLWDDDRYNKTEWMNREINEGYRQMVRETLCSTGTSTQTTVSGTRTYAIPVDSLTPPSIDYVAYDSDKLSLKSKEELIALGSLDLQGTPTGYYIEGSNICLYPVPNEAKTLTYEYVKYPVALALDADTPVVPEEFHYGLAHFAAYRMQMSDRGASEEVLSAANWHKSQFDEYVRRLRAAVQEA